MNRTLLGSLLTGIAVPLIAQPACWALSETQVNDIAKQITVRISSESSKGSGVLIQRQDDTYTVLTAAHVLSAGNSYQMVTRDGQSHALNMSSIQRHESADLAVVTFKSAFDYPTATLSALDNLNEGNSIFVAGYPAQTAAIDENIYSFSRGQLLSRAQTPLLDGYGLVYDNQTLPGMSGGPVLNAEGHLIGIHGRADATIGIQEEQINPDVYVKSGANLGLPVDLAFSLVPRAALTFAKPVNQTLVNDLWLQANFHRRQRNNEAAIATLGKIIQIDPTYVDAYNERADIYLVTGDPLSAVLDFNQVAQLQPNAGEGFYNLGLAYSRMGSPLEAIANFEKAATLFQKNQQPEKYQAALDRLKSFNR